MLRVVVPECGPDFKLFFFVRVVIVVRTLQCESSKAVPNETVMHLSDHPTIGASTQSAWMSSGNKPNFDFAFSENSRLVLGRGSYLEKASPSFVSQSLLIRD